MNNRKLTKRLKTERAVAFLEHIAKYGTKCIWCSKLLTFLTGPHYHSTYSYDHVVPKSKNGSDESYNLVLSCRKCNNERGNHLTGLN